MLLVYRRGETFLGWDVSFFCDFTQEELSDRIGVHRQTIVALEKQKYEPSIGIVLMLSAVLNEPIDKLFFLEEKTD